jgi:glutathione synthase/RimK-type ligase-like ATP-grasp enzyme
MTVLIIAYDGYDADITEVTAALEARGARAIRFDTDALPSAVRLSLGYGGEGGATLILGSGAIDLTTISAVWLRGLQEGRALPEMDADQRRVCVEAAQVSLTGLLAALGGWQLDPQERVRRAEHKPLQLQVAQALGLPIPPTLISNDPDAVRAFARSCPGGMITKMVVSKFFRTDEAGEIESVYTNLVTPETLEDLRGLHLCPMIFQARVPKALELQVTVVGHRVFTAAVDSQIAAGARVDWRRDQGPLCGAWRPYALPMEVEEKLLRLLDHFGLNFGAIDLILTPGGQYVLLEVNPLGSFSWLEYGLWEGRFPLSGAVADLLLGRAPRRV